MKIIVSVFCAAILLTACQENSTPNKSAPHSESKSVTSSISTAASTQSFAATEAALRAGLEARGLKLFAVVDHGAGAKSIGEDIGSSKLFIFGNPKAGTPLMQSDPRLGLELPMKILLREAGGKVTLHRADIAATVRSYGVSDQDVRLGKISGNLDGIMAEAAGK